MSVNFRDFLEYLQKKAGAAKPQGGAGDKKAATQDQKGGKQGGGKKGEIYQTTFSRIFKNFRKIFRWQKVMNDSSTKTRENHHKLV